MKLKPEAVRALALAELNTHTPPGGVAIDDAATFDALQMDSLDILAFAYGVESELTGFNGDDIEWNGRTTIGKAIADIQQQHAKAHQ